ncbi:MAG: ABC-F family ATP-binding cassette domain-containing protein [Zavarzinella sp.]
MLLMSGAGLARGFDRGYLFDDLSFELYHGERVGLVGPNGAGKTTLMRILGGQDTPDAGDVRLHAGARALLLEQHAEFPADATLFGLAKSAFAELLHAQEELIVVADAMSHTTEPVALKGLTEKYDRLSELLRHHDAFSLDHKVEEVLSGLGFAEKDFHRTIHTFSGGQQRRLLLARMLLSAPDVMLLDEPSNHLDIQTVKWLEDYLIQQPQAMIIVSHDRYFLNKVVTRIFELHERKITPYPGNYSQYVRLREERYQLQMKEYVAQKEYIEKQEEYIRRVHYGQLAKQAQSRMKSLEKIERLEAPTKIESPHMHFGDVVRAGDVIFEVDDLGKAYGDRWLFRNLSFQLQRGKRLGILGPNGCGKTTLLKILLGQEEPVEGKVHRGHLIDVGYLDQHLNLLDEEKTVLQAVWPEPDPELNEQKMRDLLGRFGLAGKILEQPVKECSGGERSRAALARLVVEGVNVLILDEPTNHLDLWACDALEASLKAFEGTVIVVSHDRYFLNNVCDLLVVMESNKVEVIYGNYELYETIRARREEEAAAQKKQKQALTASAVPQTTPTSSGSKSGKKKRRFPYRKLADIETDIASQEAKLAELEAQSASPEMYRDAQLVKENLAAIEACRTKLAQLYEHWEEAVELN